jgi:hypothetical protein
MVTLADNRFDCRIPPAKFPIAAACLTGEFAEFSATNVSDTTQSATPANAQRKIVYIA